MDRTSFIRKQFQSLTKQLNSAILFRETVAFSFEDKQLDFIPASDDELKTVFSRVCAEELMEMFDQLSEKEKELIRMRHIDQMSYAEMATSLNMKEGAVRTAISRAKKHLEGRYFEREGQA